MTIAPDTKDWTWVLERSCPECGYDARAVLAADVAASVRACAEAFCDVLERPDVAVRTRLGAWSALEYGCHIRDVCRLYLERLGLMLEHDDPLYANWDQDATAIEGDYAAQDPAQVRTELDEASDALALRLEGVSQSAWTRTGRRSDGAVFTIDSFARYMLHDLVHHLWDVGASIDWRRGTASPKAAQTDGRPASST